MGIFDSPRDFFFVISDVFKYGVWEEASYLKDPDLKRLSENMQSTVIAARAIGTAEGYVRAFRRWRDFAQNQEEISVFPAEPLHVALYLQYLIETTKSHNSVDSVFYGIKWAHESAGLQSPTDNMLVAKVREAAKRILGTEKRNRKDPLSVDILKQVVENSDLSDILQLRNVCMFVLCFSGFFRCDDVSRIRRNEISFQEDHMIIKVSKSKNDQLRKGNEVLIAKAQGNICPVNILKEYLSRVQIEPDSTKYIFRQLIKTKSAHKLVNKDQHISYSTFRDHFKKSLKSIVPNTQIFGTQSCRSGGATSAANDSKERAFPRHGRWRSVNAKNGYVDDSVSVRLAVSKSLGL